jgi:hypothetical protein
MIVGVASSPEAWSSCKDKDTAKAPNPIFQGALYGSLPPASSSTADGIFQHIWWSAYGSWPVPPRWIESWAASTSSLDNGCNFNLAQIWPSRKSRTLYLKVGRWTLTSQVYWAAGLDGTSNKLGLFFEKYFLSSCNKEFYHDISVIHITTQSPLMSTFHALPPPSLFPLPLPQPNPPPLYLHDLGVLLFPFHKWEKTYNSYLCGPGLFHLVCNELFFKSLGFP